jgi:hypothetical protein
MKARPGCGEGIPSESKSILTQAMLASLLFEVRHTPATICR